jgi:hypothetical protein
MARDAHPDQTGPNERDTDRLIHCPDCGLMEWWTELETEDHGYCRSGQADYKREDCPACN